MGDAAFLLIAVRPDAALVVLPLSFTVGIASGWIVDALSGNSMQPDTSAHCELAPLIGQIRARDWLYLGLGIPGLAIGVTQLIQMDIFTFWGEANVYAVALAGTFTGLFVWSASNLKAMTNAADSPVTRIAEETSFISVWVIGAYLVYDYAAAYAGLDLAAWFSSIAPVLPLIGIIVGFVPGCGPQVLVTTLYVNGVIPFSALIGNAISNDGDALFPAIALNPKAAVWATIYSAVPALIVAYGFYFLAPGFLN